MIGVVAAKAHSKRFKNKNIHLYKGAPLFWHNVEVLKKMNIKVYVTTDSDFIKDYCQSRDVKVIWRRGNINYDEQSIFEVLKYVHYCIDNYDLMINILANTIDVKLNDVRGAIALMKNSNLQEVRSYDEQGIENGLMVLRSSVFQKHEISAYVGMIQTDSKEIHYKKDI